MGDSDLHWDKKELETLIKVHKEKGYKGILDFARESPKPTRSVIFKATEVGLIEPTSPKKSNTSSFLKKK